MWWRNDFRKVQVARLKYFSISYFLFFSGLGCAKPSVLPPRAGSSGNPSTPLLSNDNNKGGVAMPKKTEAGGTKLKSSSSTYDALSSFIPPSWALPAWLWTSSSYVATAPAHQHRQHHNHHGCKRLFYQQNGYCCCGCKVFGSGGISGFGSDQSEFHISYHLSPITFIISVILRSSIFCHV